MLHLAMVRSPFAHATITSVDTAAATASPGVLAVYTGADLAEEQGGLPNAWAIVPSRRRRPTRRSPSTTWHFAGEIVAVVVARSAAEARDAVELVDVEYDELPPVLDLTTPPGRGAGAPRPRHQRLGACGCFDSAEAGTGGDVEDAIAAARADGIVIEREFRQQRLIPAFMEPRSIAVDPTGEQLTVWTSTQVPHFVRIFLSLVLGIPESKIRVIAPDVGGGFGGKLQFTPEEVLTVIAARHTGKPCKYTETRTESLMAAHHGRDQFQRLTLAATKEGTVTGLKVELTANMGAYLGLVTSAIPILGAFMYNGIYKFPAYRLELTNVFTNMAWTDAYRGAGRPEATFAVERMMDELAAELGVDPLAVRSRTGSGTTSSPSPPCAGSSTTPATTRGPPTSAKRAVRLRRASRGAATSAARAGPGPAGHRRVDVHGDVRPGAVPLARLKGYVAADGTTRRSGCCRPARWRLSPAPARTARVTRRRGRRSSRTGSGWRSTTSRCCTATPDRHPRPRHVRLAVPRCRGHGCPGRG